MGIPRHLRSAFVIIVVLCVLGLIAKAAAMLTMPTHVDSGYYLNIGVDYQLRGGLTPYMWRLPDNTNIIGGGGVGYGLLLLMWWYELFGISHVAGHSFMYLCGLITVFSMFAAVREWRNESAGVAAAALFVLSTSPFFLFQLRMDAPGVMMVSVALWAYFAATRRGHLWLHFLTGVLLVLSTEFHILGLLTIGAITFTYVVLLIADFVQNRWGFNWKPFIAYAAGGAVAGGIYAAVHILPDIETYFLISRTCKFCEPAGISKELTRYHIFWRSRPMEAVLLVLAVIAAFWRNQPQDRQWLLMLLGGVLSFAVISPPSQIEYMSHFSPVYLAGVAALLSEGISKSVSRFPKPRQVMMAISVFLILLAINSYRTFLFAQIPHGPGPQVQRILEDDLPDDTVIMGYWGHFEYLQEYTQYLIYGFEEQYTITLRNETYTDFLEREQPQVFIGDPSETAALVNYMEANDFQQVIDGLWYHGELCAEYDCEI